MITASEIRELSERIVLYSNRGVQPRTCIIACRRAVEALARLGSVVSQIETRKLAATVGGDPQLPFDGSKEAKA